MHQIRDILGGFLEMNGKPDGSILQVAPVVTGLRIRGNVQLRSPDDAPPLREEQAEHFPFLEHSHLRGLRHSRKQSCKTLCGDIVLETAKRTGKAAIAYLRVQRPNHDCLLGAECFERLQAPAQVGHQPAPGLRFGNRRVQAPCAALHAFALLAHGFSRRQLQERVAPLLGESIEWWPPGRTSYDLR